jgi:DNA anti-recombination protein RmuC
MAISNDDRRDIRETLVDPVNARVGRVERRMDAFDERLQRTNETQAVVSDNVSKFMDALVQERDERLAEVSDLYGLNREVKKDIVEVKTAVVGSQSSTKGFITGALKAVGIMLAVFTALLGALGFANAMGWLGPVGG